MFQPQPTPYASFYGVGPSLPSYAYDQQPPHLISGAYLGGEAGVGNELEGQQIGRAGGGGGGGGNYGGPSSALPAGFGGIEAPTGARANGRSGAPASGPPEATSLLFTSPAFTTANNGAGSGAFQPSFTSDNNHHHHHRRRQQQQHHHHNPGNTLRNQHHRRQTNIKMESELTGDLAAQEAAAREYQPHLEGPLVGDRTPSHVITAEYAKADPVYVQKTLGDGNCGWRAIGFSYFEALIRTGDASLVSAERDRLIRYPILDHSEMVYEDMRDEVAILMNEIEAALPNQGAAMRVLVQKFNDLDVANHLLYYLRLLASSWLKGDPSANEYLGFIPEEIGILGYCQNYLELPGREIEHLGIMLLYNVLLKPCGMVIEIAYLDRTPGPAVNTYRIPSEANGRDISTLGPVIYLLFRPDHYDILYPHEAPAAPLDIQVNRVSSFTHEHQITPSVQSLQSLQNFAEVDMSALSLIPGLGLGPGVPALAVPTASSVESYTPSPQSPWLPAPFADTLPIRQQQQQQQQQPQQPQPQQQPQLKQEQSTPVLRAVSVHPQPVRRQTPTLRFSEYCHPQLVESDTWPEPCFTTNTFKNSHFNTAHYNNPNFQPEEYRPDVDDSPCEVARPISKRRSH